MSSLNELRETVEELMNQAVAEDWILDWHFHESSDRASCKMRHLSVEVRRPPSDGSQDAQTQQE